MLASAFFVLSKIIGFMILVETWLVIGCVVTLIAIWRHALTAARLAISATLALLLLTLSPLTDIALYQLERSYPTNPNVLNGPTIHGLIVLGGSTIPHHSNTWQQIEMNDAAERVTAAAQLARKLPDAKLLLSGGSGSPINAIIKRDVRSEAAMTRDLLLDLGLDGRRLILEEKSRNTSENATYSAAVVSDDISKRWVLITSAFHMPRAMESFRKAGWNNLVAYPVDHRSDPANFASNWYPAGKLDRANLVIKELVGLVVYTLTGR